MKPTRPENCTDAEWQEILASADHANRPDFELPSSNVPTEKEKIVRELILEDIADLKASTNPNFPDLVALENHISQKGLEVLRPAGLWFAGIHHGRNLKVNDK